MKKCVILAGINGVGKSEILKGWDDSDIQMSDYDYICWDDIAKKYGSNLSAYKRASKELRDKIEKFKRNGIDFRYETTLASIGTIGDIRQIKEAGYSVDVYYAYVFPIEKVIGRIIKRQTDKGGHGAIGIENPAEFEMRLHNSLKHLRQIAELGLCNTARLFDNSDDLDTNNDFSKIKLVAILKKGEKNFRIRNDYVIPADIQNHLPFSM